MFTTSAWFGLSGPATPSPSTATPSRSDASGVLSSCDTWRRKRALSASSSVSRSRSQSSCWLTRRTSFGPRMSIGRSSRFSPSATMARSSRWNGLASQMPKPTAISAASRIEPVTCCVSCWRLRSNPACSASLRAAMMACTFCAMAALWPSSSRKARATSRSRSRAVSGGPRAARSPRRSAAARVGKVGRQLVVFEPLQDVARVARGLDEALAQRLSPSTSDWRAARSMVRLRSDSDCAAVDSAIAWAVPSRLCVEQRLQREQRAHGGRAQQRPISTKAISSSCWNDSDDGLTRAAWHQHLAAQRMRQRLGDAHVDHLAHQPRPFGPPSKLTMRLHSVRPISSAGSFLAAGATALDQDALHRAHAAGADALHVGFDRGLQVLQALELDLVRRVVGQVGRRACPGAG
jgi:hypothetical protein